MNRPSLHAVPDPDEDDSSRAGARAKRKRRHYRVRKDGTRAYPVRFIQPDGSRGHETFDTAAEADAFRAKLREAKRLGQRAIDTRSTVPELAAIAGKLHFDHLEHATQDMHRESLVNRILPFAGDKRVASIDDGWVSEFVAWMQTSGRVKDCRKADGSRFGKWDRVPLDHPDRAPAGAATIRKTMQTLLLMLDIAVKKKMLTHNAAKGIDTPDETPRVGRAASLDQIQALMVAAPTERDRAFIGMAPYTGMRLGEIRAVEWVDIDWNATAEWSEGWIHLRRAARRDGSVKATKTVEPIRSIPILARRELERWKSFAPNRSGLVFTDRNGNIMNPDNWRADVWVPTKDRAARWLLWKLAADGVDEHDAAREVDVLRGLDFHEFGRHTFVSLCAASGIPMLAAMQFSGHKSPATWNKYKHHYTDEAKRHAKALKDWLTERGHG